MIFRLSAVQSTFVFRGLPALIAALVVLVSCGSGSSGPGLSSYIGYFFGSPIENAGYINLNADESDGNRTNQEGEYVYQADDDIVFHIGNLFFPKVKSDRYVTAVDMSSTNSQSDIVSINIERLLLSLDENRDVSDGIKIPEELWVFAQNNEFDIDFNASGVNFDNQEDVVAIVNYPGSINTRLVESGVAENQLALTNDEIALIYSEIDTTAEFTETEPAVKLAGSDIRVSFTGEYFVDLKREFWWEFSPDMTTTRVQIGINGGITDVWDVLGDQLCFEINGEYGCRDVYRSGTMYRFTNIEDPSLLESLIFKSVESDFEGGFPPEVIDVE